jgi:hypothetical protein
MLDEYIGNVLIDNKKDKLKLWANNSSEAIDTLVALDIVSDIYKITRLKDNKEWEFNGNINILKELRNKIDDEGLIYSHLVTRGKEND